jgi:microcystin-dependent protein
MIDFIGSTSPYSNLVIPIGQAISRTTYASLFALIGTTYGAGDGSATFGLPDLRGRVTAMLDPTGTILTANTMSPNGNTLGAKGGAEIHALTASEIPAITSNVSTSGTLSGGTSAFEASTENTSTGGGAFPAGGPVNGTSLSVSVSGSMSGSATSNNTGGAAHTNVQPTIGVNKLLRIA